MGMAQRARTIAGLVFAGVTVCATPAPAQQADAGGVWFALGIVTDGESTIATAFEPTPLFGLEGAGSGSQTVVVEGSNGISFEAGGQWFPSRLVGLEVWVARDSTESETTSNYHTTLTYISRPPPDNLPREFHYDSTQQLDVATSFTRVTLGINGAVRPVISRRVSWIVSGGLARVHTSCEASPLGFSTFALGGHSTLFSNEYRLTAECKPASAWRANVGTMVDAKMAAHLAFTAGARVVLGADQEMPLRVVEVDHSQAGFEPPSTAQIESAMSESAARVPTASWTRYTRPSATSADGV